MSSLYPARLDDPDRPNSRQVAKARRAQTDAELEVFRYGLGAQMRADFDRHDSQSIADASKAALESELDLLDYGMGRAGMSAAKVELVARHVERLAAINERRINRRFGG